MLHGHMCWTSLVCLHGPVSGYEVLAGFSFTDWFCNYFFVRIGKDPKKLVISSGWREIVKEREKKLL